MSSLSCQQHSARWPLNNLYSWFVLRGASATADASNADIGDHSHVTVQATVNQHFRQINVKEVNALLSNVPACSLCVHDLFFQATQFLNPSSETQSTVGALLYAATAYDRSQKLAETSSAQLTKIEEILEKALHDYRQSHDEKNLNSLVKYANSDLNDYLSQKGLFSSGVAFHQQIIKVKELARGECRSSDLEPKIKRLYQLIVCCLKETHAPFEIVQDFSSDCWNSFAHLDEMLRGRFSKTNELKMLLIRSYHLNIEAIWHYHLSYCEQPKLRDDQEKIGDLVRKLIKELPKEIALKDGSLGSTFDTNFYLKSAKAAARYLNLENEWPPHGSPWQQGPKHFDELYQCLVSSSLKKVVEKWYLDTWKLRWNSFQTTDLKEFKKKIEPDLPRFLKKGREYTICLAIVFFNFVTEDHVELHFKNFAFGLLCQLAEFERDPGSCFSRLYDWSQTRVRGDRFRQARDLADNYLQRLRRQKGGLFYREESWEDPSECDWNQFKMRGDLIRQARYVAIDYLLQLSRREKGFPYREESREYLLKESQHITEISMQLESVKYSCLEKMSELPETTSIMNNQLNELENTYIFLRDRGSNRSSFDEDLMIATLEKIEAVREQTEQTHIKYGQMERATHQVEIFLPDVKKEEAIFKDIKTFLLTD